MTTERLHMTIERNDAGPLGLREFPAMPYPREMTRLTLPLSSAGNTILTGTLTVPTTMTRFEWDNMMATIALMEKALVLSEPVR